ncbi:MAG TPA: amidohydrolase family protein [Vicinamibacterales bacterium]|nr:amidohydrolase family protein [Vicinamibacterales bacterium]
MIDDVHCHFFSSSFLELLTRNMPGLPEPDRAAAVAARLGWADPGSAEALSGVWVNELDRHAVSRASLIASIPGDEDSVAEAVRLYPDRFVGFFMFNPLAPDASSRLERALSQQKMRCVCLFPAMHEYAVNLETVGKVFEAAASHGAAVFVHCGVLTVGVRAKLGLPSSFNLRSGDPLAVASVASAFPQVPVIIPHFGAGMFREALMAADQCGNIHLDTSSSNSWMKYYPGLTLDTVFRQALSVLGAQRILFGTDSSFFPRGWQKGIYVVQTAAMKTAGASEADRQLMLGGNFERLFPRESVRITDGVDR